MGNLGVSFYITHLLVVAVVEGRPNQTAITNNNSLIAMMRMFCFVNRFVGWLNFLRTYRTHDSVFILCNR